MRSYTVHEPHCGAAVNSTSDGRASCCKRPPISPSWRGLRVVCHASSQAAQQLPPHRHVPLLPPKPPSSCLLIAMCVFFRPSLLPADAWSMCMQVRAFQIVAVMLRPRLLSSRLFLFFCPTTISCCPASPRSRYQSRSLVC